MDNPSRRSFSTLNYPRPSQNLLLSFQQSSFIKPTLAMQSPLSKANTESINRKTCTPLWVANHIFDEKGKKLSIDALLKGAMEKTWRKSTSNELARLSDGIPSHLCGTKAVCWIHKLEVPTGKKITYANKVSSL